MSNLKLIKLSDTHYVIVDDSEIKEGDWFIVLSGSGYSVYSIHKAKYESDGSKNWNDDHCKKITHSTQPLEGHDYLWRPLVKSLSLSEIEEAINGYSVEKMRHDYLNSEKIKTNKKWNTKQYFDYDLRGIDLKGRDEFLYKKLLLKLYSETGAGYMDGFKAHQELVKDKMFTLEDMEEAFNEGVSYGIDKGVPFEKYKKKLLPKTEWNVTFDEQGKLIMV